MARTRTFTTMISIPDPLHPALVHFPIVLILAGTAVAVVAVFHFIFMWNDFLRPLLYLQDPAATTLPVGLAGFVTRVARQWHLLLAGSAIALAPLVIIFALAQRVIARGISVAGVRK